MKSTAARFQDSLAPRVIKIDSNYLELMQSEPRNSKETSTSRTVLSEISFPSVQVLTGCLIAGVAALLSNEAT